MIVIMMVIMVVVATLMLMMVAVMVVMVVVIDFLTSTAVWNAGFQGKFTTVTLKHFAQLNSCTLSSPSLFPGNLF